LKQYYIKSPFGEDGGLFTDIAHVYVGPYLIPIRNSPQRKAVIPYHDLHHMVSGYNNSRIGEGEVGAWELGTNCWNRPVTVPLNLGGMVTGLLYSPSRLYKAFILGCQCRNLYNLDLTKIIESDYSEINWYVHSKNSGHNEYLNNLRFGLYLFAACLMMPVALSGGFVINLISKLRSSE